MQKAACETDLTEAQWNLIQPLLPAPKVRGRPRTSLREVLDAHLLYRQGGLPVAAPAAPFSPVENRLASLPPVGP